MLMNFEKMLISFTLKIRMGYHQKTNAASSKTVIVRNHQNLQTLLKYRAEYLLKDFKPECYCSQLQDLHEP